MSNNAEEVRINVGGICCLCGKYAQNGKVTYIKGLSRFRYFLKPYNRSVWLCHDCRQEVNKHEESYTGEKLIKKKKEREEYWESLIQSVLNNEYNDDMQLAIIKQFEFKKSYNLHRMIELYILNNVINYLNYLRFVEDIIYKMHIFNIDYKYEIDINDTRYTLDGFKGKLCDLKSYGSVLTKYIKCDFFVDNFKEVVNDFLYPIVQDIKIKIDIYLSFYSDSKSDKDIVDSLEEANSIYKGEAKSNYKTPDTKNIFKVQKSLIKFFNKKYNDLLTELKNEPTDE